MKEVMCGIKWIKNPKNELFLGTTGLNVVIDNPESLLEVVRSIIGKDLILLLNSPTITMLKMLKNEKFCLKC